MTAQLPNQSRQNEIDPLDGDQTGSGFQSDAMSRLASAERSGLRLAILCRTIIVGLAFVWYLGIGLLPDFVPRLAALLALGAFTAIGVAHLAAIGTRFDRWWLKYVIYALDIGGVCALFALIPISRADDVPQIIAFRAYGIYYLFPLVTLASLSLSWRLVVWAGLVSVAGWWLVFWHVAGKVANPLSWGDIPSDATRADYETIFLSIDFIGRGNRIEETGLLLAGALVLAFSVYRARRVFLKQVAAEMQRKSEQERRERVTRALGRYVPSSIADQLLEDEGRLAPQQREGSILVMDIADFSKFASTRSPAEVIAELDTFLAGQADIVTRHNGVVISFTGDGLLAAFNTPVPVDDHETAAISAACELLQHAAMTQFDIRIGVASGALASGSVGSQSRQAFTVYGETVNRAARLEECAKTMGQQLLADEPTALAAGALHKFARVATVELRGLSAPISVFTCRPKLT